MIRAIVLCLAVLLALLLRYVHHNNFADEGKIRIAIFLGTRPETIKLAPLIHYLLKHNSTTCQVFVVNSGQHLELVQQTLAAFPFIQVHHDLRVMNKEQNVAHLVSHIISEATTVLQQLKPQVTIVQGDTATALGAALASYFLRIPVAHVEAGLRSFDYENPFPEEMNRKLITNVASLHFAHSQQAANALLREHVCRRNVFVTGNTIVDTVVHATHDDPLLMARARELTHTDNLYSNNSVKILVTTHRRENIQLALSNICRAICTLVNQYPHQIQFIVPVHLNPEVRERVYSKLENTPQVKLLEPIPYQLFRYVLRQVDIVLTDSGGIFEEAVTIGKHVIVLRNVTERSEGMDGNWALLAGTTFSQIVSTTSQVIKHHFSQPNMWRQSSTHSWNKAFGDGKASARIAAILGARLGNLDICTEKPPFGNTINSPPRGE